jgi:hypothetical protein
MLTEILSSDKILNNGTKNQKSEKDLKSGGDQFSKILKSLDDDTLPKNVKGVSKNDLLSSLQSVFEDDKEFLKETLSFLEKGESGTNQTNVNIKSLTGVSLLSSALQGLDIKSKESGPVEDGNFKVIINQAKQFLQNELKKVSISDGEMPKTLRGLVDLASSKGIELKNVKFSLDNLENSKTISKSDNHIETTSKSENSKLIINQHSTEALLRSRSQTLVLKAGKTDQTPENLTGVKNSTEANSIEKIDKSFNLSSLLSNANEVQKTDTSSKKSTLNLSKSSMNLGDVLQVKDELSENSPKVLMKNNSMAEKVGKFTGITTELISSLFSEDELADFGIEAKVVSISDEVETSILSGNDKIKSEIELKIGEAKTMSRHLASNLKEQIENYKSPFQKISLTLNPEKLGEVDVDIVKRGSNVNITLTGSTQTLAVLSANSGELRNQLLSAGMENPTFKFNEDGRNGSGEQRRERNEREDLAEAEDEKESFEIDLSYYI